jgi:hypothetical protein
MEIDPQFPVLDGAAREQLQVARAQLEAEAPDASNDGEATALALVQGTAQS